MAGATSCSSCILLLEHSYVVVAMGVTCAHHIDNDDDNEATEAQNPR
jgi:hypothetical protein